MKYFDHKSFFYCHCGFSLQRTETFHKVFDADDVEVIILECVSLFMATTTKLQKTNLEQRKRRYTKKVRGSKIVQKTFFFLTGGAISLFLTYTYYMPFAMVSISDLIILKL